MADEKEEPTIIRSREKNRAKHLIFCCICLGIAALFFFLMAIIIAEITFKPEKTVTNTTDCANNFPNKDTDLIRNEDTDLLKLRIPNGYAIKLYTKIHGARFMLALPGDDVLVSIPSRNKIVLIRPPSKNKSETTVLEFATGLRQPHDMVRFRDSKDNRDYIYVAESNQIGRYPYQKGDTKLAKGEILVANLPDNKNYGYNHYLKNIAVGNNTLYVSIASTSNADPEDLKGDPKRGAIYGYSLTGRNRRLVSEGIRNAEGLAFSPGTNDLWIVVNQRDNIKNPHKGDDYGLVLPEYVDENPLEEFSKVVEGQNYGWPYCNPARSKSMNDLDYLPDVDNNPDESVVKCSSFRKVDKGMEAHSAPLGLTFWTGEKVPKEFKGGALVAMHGSWNRRVVSGNKVMFFPWDNGRPGNGVDLVTGWVTDAEAQQRWGRPVDVAVLEDGSVLISDDYNGAVYKLYVI